MLDIIKAIHFHNLTWLLALPSAMMAIDILTGLINAWKSKDFQSTKMRSGLAKKAGELLIIVIAVLFTFGLDLPAYILKFISLYIILMELMSVVENLDKVGAPLPKFVKDAINNAADTVNNDDLKDIERKLKRVERMLEQYKLVPIEVEDDDLK